MSSAEPPRPGRDAHRQAAAPRAPGRLLPDEAIDVLLRDPRCSRVGAALSFAVGNRTLPHPFVVCGAGQLRKRAVRRRESG